MTNSQKKIYNLLKHPMNVNTAFERSNFRNRHHFDMVIDAMLKEGHLSQTTRKAKRDQICDEETIIGRSKPMGAAKVIAGSLGMFIWFYVVPTIVFILAGE